jgi:hypothetical protein
MPAGHSNATVYIYTGLGARGPPLELFLAKSKAVRAETKAANYHVKERKANNVIPCEIKFVRNLIPWEIRNNFNDSRVYQHVTSTLDYKIVPTL